MNLANKITLSRMLFVPLMMIPFFIKFPYHKLVTAIIFAIAAATDCIDGYIARKTHTVTTVGKFLDPIADKILVSVALFMVVAGDFLYKPIVLTVILSSIIIARELLIDGFRLIALSKSIVISADKIGKAKTFSSIVALSFILSDVYIVVSYIGWLFFIIATVLTVISGANYIIKFKNVIE